MDIQPVSSVYYVDIRTPQCLVAVLAGSVRTYRDFRNVHLKFKLVAAMKLSYEMLQVGNSIRLRNEVIART